jgi:hypothetical protein
LRLRSGGLRAEDSQQIEKARGRGREGGIGPGRSGGKGVLRHVCVAAIRSDLSAIRIIKLMILLVKNCFQMGRAPLQTTVRHVIVRRIHQS